jgi:hypothetical protein
MHQGKKRFGFAAGMAAAFVINRRAERFQPHQKAETYMQMQGSSGR